MGEVVRALLWGEGFQQLSDPFAQRVFGSFLALDLDRARLDVVQRVDAADQGGFAGTRGADVALSCSIHLLYACVPLWQRLSRYS